MEAIEHMERARMSAEQYNTYLARISVAQVMAGVAAASVGVTLIVLSGGTVLLPMSIALGVGSSALGVGAVGVKGQRNKSMKVKNKGLGHFTNSNSAVKGGGIAVTTGGAAKLGLHGTQELIIHQFGKEAVAQVVGQAAGVASAVWGIRCGVKGFINSGKFNGDELYRDTQEGWEGTFENLSRLCRAFHGKTRSQDLAAWLSKRANRYMIMAMEERFVKVLVRLGEVANRANGLEVGTKKKKKEKEEKKEKAKKEKAPKKEKATSKKKE
jgi:hypothetical protein